MNEYIVLMEEVWGENPEYVHDRQIMHVIWADTPTDAVRTIHAAYDLTPATHSRRRVIGVMRTQREYPAVTVFDPYEEGRKS